MKAQLQTRPPISITSALSKVCGVQKEEKETGRREERFRIVRGAATNKVSNEPRVGS